MVLISFIFFATLVNNPKMVSLQAVIAISLYCAHSVISGHDFTRACLLNGYPATGGVGVDAKSR